MILDPSALASQMEASAKLLRLYGPRAVKLAREWHSPLRSSGSGRGSKGDHSDPTLAAVEEALHAESRGQPIPYRYFDALNNDATAVSTHLADLMAVVVELGRAATPHTLAPERKPSAGAGQCQGCPKWVSGAANDRLRSGYCDACRKKWDRAGRPDRATFARDQRSEPDDGTDIYERLNPGHQGEDVA